MPYNEAPVINGSEPNQARVELLRDWMSSYRPGSGDGPAGDVQAAYTGAGIDVQQTLD